ncbi:hypothetical protein BSR04_18905 [Serratia plymuthica]|nr:hypothetical protein BSR04_18905 [Serratia plymuthica]
MIAAAPFANCITHFLPFSHLRRFLRRNSRFSSRFPLLYINESALIFERPRLTHARRHRCRAITGEIT